jgi:hypothetical protein
MKRALLLLALIISAVTVSRAQSQRMYTSYAPKATTSWDSLGFAGTRVAGFNVVVDSIGATDTLFVAAMNDTLPANIYPLFSGEAKLFNLGVRWMRTKCKTGTAKRRIDAR